MKRKIFIFLLISISIGCNQVLLVKRDRVLQKRTGFILFSSFGDYFIPSEIRKEKSPVEEFKVQKLKQGFQIFGLSSETRAKLITMYADTLIREDLPQGTKSSIAHIFLIPVEMEYLDRIEKNKKIKADKKKVNAFPLTFNRQTISFSYNTMDKFIINIFPYMSKDRMMLLEENYLKNR